ncbi:unnamed protein product, partial [Mesorhabditis spiculigera]
MFLVFEGRHWRKRETNGPAHLFTITNPRKETAAFAFRLLWDTAMAEARSVADNTMPTQVYFLDEDDAP